MKGRLYLIPNLIAESTQLQVIPPQVKQVLPSIHYFLAEDVRTARRYLSSLSIYSSIEALNFEVLNKDTPSTDLPRMMMPINEGHHIGIISESGCPGVADPGAIAVQYAHQHGIEVVPLVGPSSLLLALMASGLNGQQFAFQGYLPIDVKDGAKKIKDLEKESAIKKQTQIFIETPYRNKALFDQLIKNLLPNTRLTVAIDITGKNEFIKTNTIAQWRKAEVSFQKLPTVFLFLA